MEIVLTVSALLFLVLVTLFSIARFMAKRRLRKSHYGHVFDFSKMPKQKIKAASEERKSS